MNNNTYRNKEGGFLKLIIIIVIALALMRYYHVTVYDVIDWLKSLSFTKIWNWFTQTIRDVFYR